MITKRLISLFTKIGGDRILHRNNKTPRILFWHGVDYVKNPAIEAESVHIDQFKEQIAYIKKYFNIISLDQFFIRFTNNAFIGNEIVLTFDDGYRNNLTLLAPVLWEQSIPFAVFITTNNITNGDIFPTSLIRLIVHGSNKESLKVPFLNFEQNLNSLEKRNEITKTLSKEIKTRPLHEVEIICKELKANISKEEFSALRKEYTSITPMNWDEVREIIKYGCTIGSHCLDHICCHNAQSKDEVRKQIFNSKKIIEDELGCVCDYFVYPNGNYTKDSNKYVLEAGYKIGFSTKPLRIGKDSHKAIIPRICVPNNIDLAKIKINYLPR